MGKCSLYVSLPGGCVSDAVSVQDAFDDGATYCDHTQTLSFQPHRLKSCLLDHVVTLDCTETGPLRCGGNAKQTVFVNGVKKENVKLVVSPFDHRIEVGTNLTSECTVSFNAFFFVFFIANGFIFSFNATDSPNLVLR